MQRRQVKWKLCFMNPQPAVECERQDVEMPALSFFSHRPSSAYNSACNARCTDGRNRVVNAIRGGTVERSFLAIIAVARQIVTFNASIRCSQVFAILRRPHSAKRYLFRIDVFVTIRKLVFSVVDCQLFSESLLFRKRRHHN